MLCYTIVSSERLHDKSHKNRRSGPPSSLVNRRLAAGLEDGHCTDCTLSVHKAYQLLQECLFVCVRHIMFLTNPGIRAQSLRIPGIPVLGREEFDEKAAAEGKGES